MPPCSYAAATTLEIYDSVFARFWRERGQRLGDDGPTSMVADPEVVQADEDEAGGCGARGTVATADPATTRATASRSPPTRTVTTPDAEEASTV